jgi:spore maturation protein CgeB
MKSLTQLASIMRGDWDRRVQHDYRFWITNEISKGSVIWEEGQRDFEIFLKGINPNSSQTALEIGCGVGRMLKAATNHFGKVIGVDVSPKAVEKAAELLGQGDSIELVANSGFDLSSIPGASVDLVWSFASLPHMPTRVFASYLLEIRRVLKTSGCARLHIFLGLNDNPAENDTLRLRAYVENDLRSALKLSGLELTEVTPTQLPLGDLLEELSLESVMITLAPGAQPSGDVQAIAEALLPGRPEVDDARMSCSAFEGWLALHYADRLYQDGEFDRARAVLEYVAQHCQTAGIDVRDTLDRISRTAAQKEVGEKLGSESVQTEYYSGNLEVIRQRFPVVYELLSSSLNDAPGTVEIRPTADGPAVWVNQTCLDHGDKPAIAAANWVKRALNDERFKSCSHVVVVGFGCGYHLESLLDKKAYKVSCIEPSCSALRKVLSARDLRPLLASLDSLMIVSDKSNYSFDGNSELLVRPQVIPVYGDLSLKITSAFYSQRGLSKLHPKIAVLGPLQGGTLPIYHYTTNALRSLGQRVRGVDMSGFNSAYELIGSFMVNSSRESLARQTYIETLSSVLLESFADKPIDILICMAQAPISPRALIELRRQGVITVLWFVEDYLRFTYWKETAKYFDYVFTIQKGECIEAIRKAGAGHVHYLPTACDPSVHVPLNLSAEERERWGSPISFVGAGYYNRRQTFAGLAHLPCKLWGTEWPTCKPFDKMVQEAGRRLTPEEYIRIFNATEINLNLHSSNERDGVDPSGDFLNPRTFELAACGAFQLVDERELLPECFKAGEEVITFSSIADLKDKIEYYRDRPEERERIAKRARERVLSEHTYQKRLEQMLTLIYATSYQKLRAREQSSPWSEMIRRAEFDPELKMRCERAFARGEEPILDGLVADIATGQGTLTETEQKLLFLFHVRKQIVRMESEGAGVRN